MSVFPKVTHIACAATRATLVLVCLCSTVLIVVGHSTEDVFVWVGVGCGHFRAVAVLSQAELWLALWALWPGHRRGCATPKPVHDRQPQTQFFAGLGV